jgi:hypothetical protein
MVHRGGEIEQSGDGIAEGCWIKHLRTDVRVQSSDLQHGIVEGTKQSLFRSSGFDGKPEF